MVLRKSISKFFQKTINNFKSFFCSNVTYQILPKTPKNTHHHHPNFNIIKAPSPPSSSSRALTLQPRRVDRDETLFCKPKVEVVIQKLKEMEKMMNYDDEEQVSDVREFLYCYSLLRCSAYIDVVDQFFMEVYSDFFSSQPLGHTTVAV